MRFSKKFIASNCLWFIHFTWYRCILEKNRVRGLHRLYLATPQQRRRVPRWLGAKARTKQFNPIQIRCNKHNWTQIQILPRTIIEWNNWLLHDCKLCKSHRCLLFNLNDLQQWKHSKGATQKQELTFLTKWPVTMVTQSTIQLGHSALLWLQAMLRTYMCGNCATTHTRLLAQLIPRIVQVLHRMYI